MHKILIFLLCLTGCNLITDLDIITDAKPNSTVPPEELQCPISNKPIWQVRFSPKGGATSLVVDAINNAKSSIFVQAYSFTSAPITEALIGARNRGIKVELILDKSNIDGKGTQYPILLNNNMITYVDSKHAIAHNKIMVIDNKVVLTGSFNFTAAAESSNAENILQLTDEKLAHIYMDNYLLHKEHSILHKKD